jgi:hypothetical protein
VQATGLEGTATRIINRDFSHSFPSFLRHFNSASVAAARSATRARRAGDATTARCNSAWVIGGNQLRFQRVAFVLRFPVWRLWSIASGGPMSWGEALLWGALIVAVLIAVLAAAYFLFQGFVSG